MPLHRLGKHDMASDNQLENDLEDPYQEWKARPSPAANSKMLSALEPTLRSAVSAYGGASASPNLYAHARRIALDVLPRYEPSRGKMRSFLMNHLQGLRRLHHQARQSLSVPEQTLLERRHLLGEESQLRDELGRDPSTAELADRTGLPTRKIASLRSAAPGISAGVLASTDSSDGPFDPAVKGDNANAWLEFVYAGLKPSDQLILEHSLGMHGKPVLDNRSIARTLGVSPAAVSQRRTGIQSQLDERNDVGVF